MCELQGRGWLRVGRAMLIVLYNCVIIDGKDDGLTWWMRSKAALIAILQFVNYQKHVKILAEQTLT